MWPNGPICILCNYIKLWLLAPPLMLESWSTQQARERLRILVFYRQLCGVSPRRPMQGAISFGRWSGPCWGSDPLQGARPAGGNDLYRPCVESSFQSYLEASLEVTCTKAVCPEVLGVRSFQTSFVLPAELMDVCLFVEVVAVLADVVQLQMINW